MLGDAGPGPSSSRTANAMPGHPTETEKPPPKQRSAKKKTVTQLAQALQKKAALKVIEADGLAASLKRAGMYLGRRE